jgi:TonB family protein
VPSLRPRFTAIYAGALALAMASSLGGVTAQPPPAAPAQPVGDEEHYPWVEEPVRRLAALDEALRHGRYERAATGARAELAAGLADGREPTIGLAEALSRLALAEAGLGRTEDALWRWHEAESLVPGVLSGAELAAFGGPGSFLAAHPPRRAGEMPAGASAGVAHRADAASGITPPRKLAGELPDPAAVRSGHPGIPASLRIEIVVDAEGRARDPVVVSGRRADLIVRSFESLRGFRFAPAMEHGAPVAVLEEVEVDPPAGRPLEALLPAGGGLEPVADLLRAGRFAEAERLAVRRWDEILNGGERSAELLGAALALRALAEAGARPGAAVCRWQAAEILSPALYDAGFAVYGAAGGLLDRNRWGSERWVVHGGADRRREGKSGAAAAPPRPRVLARAQPVYPRCLKARKLSDVAVLAGVVDAEGWLRQPELRIASTSPNLDASALDALCGFRFQPALRAGAPVPSFYSVTMEFSPE